MEDFMSIDPEDIFDRVMEAYKDRVRLVYQEFPLDFHPQAKPAGVAARCAGDQGKFWEMHTEMLRTPGALDENDGKSRAARLGLAFEPTDSFEA